MQRQNNKNLKCKVDKFFTVSETLLIFEKELIPSKPLYIYA